MHRLISAAGTATISKTLKATNSSLTYLDLRVCVCTLIAIRMLQSFVRPLANFFPTHLACRDNEISDHGAVYLAANASFTNFRTLHSAQCMASPSAEEFFFVVDWQS